VPRCWALSLLQKPLKNLTISNTNGKEAHDTGRCVCACFAKESKCDYTAKCARAHFTSKWLRPSHRPPQGRPTLLLRACTIYALGGERREPAAEDNLSVPVPRQALTRTRAYVCNPMRSPGEEIPKKAGCRRERTTKRLQMEASIIAHAWLTPANFSCCTRGPPQRTSLSDQE
jgi:hypothetical protein